MLNESREVSPERNKFAVELFPQNQAGVLKHPLQITLEGRFQSIQSSTQQYLSTALSYRLLKFPLEFGYALQSRSLQFRISYFMSDSFLGFGKVQNEGGRYSL